MSSAQEKADEIVLTALSEMWPDFDFSGCYDLADLMNHARGQLGEERDARADAIQALRDIAIGSYSVNWPRARAREALARLDGTAETPRERRKREAIADPASRPRLDGTAEPAAVTPPPEDDRPGPDWQAIP